MGAGLRYLFMEAPLSERSWACIAVASNTAVASMVKVCMMGGLYP